MKVSFDYAELVQFMTAQAAAHNAKSEQLSAQAEQCDDFSEAMALRYQSMIELGKASGWNEAWHEIHKRV